MLVTRIKKPDDEWSKSSIEYQTKAAIVSNKELPHTNTTPSSRLALCQGLFQRFYPNLSGARIHSLKSDVSRVGCWCQKLFPGICNGCRHLWHLWWWCLAPLKSQTMSNWGRMFDNKTNSLYTLTVMMEINFFKTISKTYRVSEHFSNNENKWIKKWATTNSLEKNRSQS